MYGLTMRDGFTLVEVTLSITILLILAGLAVPVLRSFQNSSDMNSAVFSTSSVIRRAQLKARSVENDDTWSVNMTTSTITLFRGSNFGARNTAFDEITRVPETIGFSGLTTITFAKYTGLPTVTGTTTVQRSTGESRGIGVNTYGILSYE